MNENTVNLLEASIHQHCKVLRTPTISSQFARMADEAMREKQSHMGYLEVLLAAEVDEREHRTVQRRITEAHLPRMKTLEEFDFAQTPKVSAAQMRNLAEGGYIERAEPIVLIGECGTGKTHLATGLCVAACRQRKRVRFTTAAALRQITRTRCGELLAAGIDTKSLPLTKWDTCPWRNRERSFFSRS